MLDHRVVVTGVGLVTPLGMDVESTWDSLISGRSGVGYITAFDSSDYATHIAAEVSDFNPNDHLDRKAARRMDRFVQSPSSPHGRPPPNQALKLPTKTRAT